MKALCSRSILALFGLFFLLAAHAATPVLKLADGTEVDIHVFAAQGNNLLVWLTCNEGRGRRENQVAQELAEGGIEVWLPDFLSGHFLPLAPSSIEQIAEDEVVSLIDLAHKTTRKRIYLVAAGRGALLALRGAHQWRQQHPKENHLAGGILLYPELYAVSPAPGVEAQYHEVVSHTSLPLFIYHSQRSPGRWWLEHLKVELRKGGSLVESLVLPEIRGYFYSRNDATPEEEAMSQRLPIFLRYALRNLQKRETP